MVKMVLAWVHFNSMDHVLFVVPVFGLQFREHHVCTRSVPLPTLLFLFSTRLYIISITVICHCSVNAAKQAYSISLSRKYIVQSAIVGIKIEYLFCREARTGILRRIAVSD